MFLATRIGTTLLVAAAVIVTRSTVAAEPAPTAAECIAASESGQDLQHTGKLREARIRFAACVAESCPGPIREDCTQRLSEIETAMPSIVFAVLNADGHDVPNVAITVDGQPSANAGSTLELDPGEHQFHFTATGMKKLEKRLVLVEGVQQRREVIIMTRVDPAPVASVVASPASGSTAKTLIPSSPPPTLAWVAFGAGGASLTLGVIAGLVAESRHGSLSSVCDNAAGTCSPDYADELDAFHTWRTISTVSYVVGALGAAGGAVLWLTAPKTPSTTTAQVFLGPASAGIAGRF